MKGKMEHTHTDLQSRFGRGKKAHQKVYTSIKSEEKPPKVLIVTYFEGDGEKGLYAIFKHTILI